MFRRLLALACLALLLTGCTTQPAMQGQSLPPATTPQETDNSVRPGVTEASLVTSDGLTRTYRLFVPDGYRPGTPLPLLIALHGGGGSGQQFAVVSGFDELAEANSFLVLYPDGDGRIPTWNGGNCCGGAVQDNIDDVAFVGQLIDEVAATVSVYSSRVYATGHSNGGILALRLACELSERIVAIGVQSAALGIQTCAPSKPVSVLQIHGSADLNVPITGGRGTAGPSRVDFAVPIQASETLARVDDCPASAAVTVDSQNPDVTVSTWSPCGGGTEVRFIEVAGAPHSWMGSTDGASPNAETPYPDLDSSAVIWEFLSQQSR